MSEVQTLPLEVLEMRRMVKEAAAFILDKAPIKPRIAVILGSGLGELAEEVEDLVSIPYGEIPHFPHSTAPGHAGRLVFGKLSGQPVMLMQGRFHTYEG
ncbi:MAG TPA: hypothetical protein V6C82_00785, partial [Chroococcales cyanobacterium]